MSQELSRREFLGSSLLASAGLVATSRLSQGAQRYSAAFRQYLHNLSGPAAQDQLRWDTATLPTSFNPIGNTNLAPVRRLTVWTQNNLLRTGTKGGVFYPDLAVGLPTVSSDGLTYDFSLREGVRWSDGTSFTSADVVATYNAVQDPANASIWASNIGSLQGVEARSPTAVRFHLKEPDNWFTAQTGLIPIVKAKEADDNEKLSTNPTGTGPFMIQSIQSGLQITLARNPNYFRSGRPYVKEIVYVAVPESTTQVVDLTDGLAALSADVDYSQLAELKQRGGFVYNVTGTPARMQIFVNINKPPLSDVNFRKALAYAVDRQAIVDEVYAGYASIGQSYLPPGVLGFDPALAPYGPKPNLAKAKAFMAKSKFKPSRPLVLTAISASNAVACSTILQANWAALGVTLQTQQVDLAAGVSDLFKNNYDFWGFSTDFVGQDLGFTPKAVTGNYQTGSPSNWLKFSNPALDAQIRIINTSQNKSAVVSAVQYLQRFDIDAVHFITLCYPHYIEARGVPLANYQANPLGLPWGLEAARIVGVSPA